MILDRNRQRLKIMSNAVHMIYESYLFTILRHEVYKYEKRNPMELSWFARVEYDWKKHCTHQPRGSEAISTTVPPTWLISRLKALHVFSTWRSVLDIWPKVKIIEHYYLANSARGETKQAWAFSLEWFTPEGPDTESLIKAQRHGVCPFLPPFYTSNWLVSSVFPDTDGVFSKITWLYTGRKRSVYGHGRLGYSSRVARRL